MSIVINEIEDQVCPNLIENFNGRDCKARPFVKYHEYLLFLQLSKIPRIMCEITPEGNAQFETPSSIVMRKILYVFF